MITKIQSAQYFATQEHVVKRGQLYGGVLPYTHHLEAVANIVSAFDLGDEDLIVAAWLHDVVEDCEVKEKNLRELFGHRVADIVMAVSNEAGENRKIRNLLTYPKIRGTEDAIIIKLADRIANTQKRGSLHQMYAKEYSVFKDNLRESVTSSPEYQEVANRLWFTLDGIMA